MALGVVEGLVGGCARANTGPRGQGWGRVGAGIPACSVCSELFVGGGGFTGGCSAGPRGRCRSRPALIAPILRGNAGERECGDTPEGLAGCRFRWPAFLYLDAVGGANVWGVGGMSI